MFKNDQIIVFSQAPNQAQNPAQSRPECGQHLRVLWNVYGPMRFSSSRDSLPTPPKKPSEACHLDRNVLCLYFIEPGGFEEQRLETTGKCDWHRPRVTRPHCWSVLLGTFEEFVTTAKISICQILKSSWIFMWLKVLGAPTSRNHVNRFFFAKQVSKERMTEGLKGWGSKVSWVTFEGGWNTYAAFWSAFPTRIYFCGMFLTWKAAA